jgi:hypothetical protein
MAAARRKAEQRQRDAEQKASELESEVEDLRKWKARQEKAAEEAEEAEKSELEKAHDRMKRVEADAEKARQEAEAAQEAVKEANRQTRVAQIAAQEAPGIDPLFLSLVDGDDDETISERLKELKDIGAKSFSPQNIGSPAQPPAGSTSRSATDRDTAADWARREATTIAASDPTHPDHAQAVEQLRKDVGR